MGLSSTEALPGPKTDGRKRERGVSTRVARTANHPASSPVVDSFRLPLTRANPARLNLVYARAVSSASYLGGTVLIDS
jgi:hypothetical protein